VSGTVLWHCVRRVCDLAHRSPVPA
jgi:hypothetical protein